MRVVEDNREVENCLFKNSSNSQSKSLLTRFYNSWEKRSRVRKHQLGDELTFEESKPDFLETLLPFYKNPVYQNLKEEQKQKILSYGWLSYNLKTIAIESKIISPICYDIIDGFILGMKNQVIRNVIAETLVDESYHILLCQHAITISEKKRNIDGKLFPRFDIVNKTEELKENYSELWQKTLISLATAIVSEVFISDYLKQLSYAKEIVTLNRETVKAHRMDELAHSNVFIELAKYIYAVLSPKQKLFFEMILPYSVQYFSSKELSVWNAILQRVCPNQAQQIIKEVLLEEWYDLNNIDYTNLVILTQEIGMSNFEERLIDLKNHQQTYRLRRT